MKQSDLEIDTDYLSVSFDYATATGLSNWLEGKISLDKEVRIFS